MELREYQKQAIDKILWAKKANLPGNDLISLPTGSGKSVIIAHLAKQLDEPILILQPSKEILEQNLEKLSHCVDKENIGVYSASMKEKVIKYFTFATIGSVYKKPKEFEHFGLVIIDECHLVDTKNLNGMYTKFFNEVNELRLNVSKLPLKIIGLTATPYRLCVSYKYENGELTAYSTVKLINRLKGFFWKRLLFNINTQDLIDQGFLCSLEYIDRSLVEHADIPLNKSKSEFDLEEYEKILGGKQLEIIRAIEYAKSIAKSVLVFCSSVKQAEKFASMLNGAVVSAKTKANEREDIVKRFKSGEIQAVFNVGVFTTGFDHPALDCIVLLRPVRSIGLYSQMLGRGLRVAEGKKSCKVIDMTSTVKSLGRVETIRLEERGKWELLSECGSWHNFELYNFKIEKKKTVEQL